MDPPAGSRFCPAVAHACGQCAFRDSHQCPDSGQLTRLIRIPETVAQQGFAALDPLGPVRLGELTTLLRSTIASHYEQKSRKPSQ
ncbi:protein of unknown function (plasmid) [Pararobbsia alpina]